MVKVAEMLKIAHIIHPVKVDKSSDLHIAQPITFETMRIAREFAKDTADISLYAIQYHDEERVPLPGCFIRVPDLNRSVADIKTFKKRKKLALIKDILDSLYESSHSDYLIYTNVDIALQPYFYRAIFKIIEQGYDAFVINRRTISDRFSTVDEIPLMAAEIGESHKGYDCFVFKREVYPKFKLGTTCIGTAWIGRVLLVNMVSYATKFKEFGNEHLTFHIGNPRPWGQDEFFDYLDKNRNEYLTIFHQLESEQGEFEPVLRSYLLDVGEKRQYPEAVFKKTGVLKLNGENGENKKLRDYKFVFIAGLHKSGTTVLADCLKEHPLISGFSNTGFPKDEGQFLQSVFPPARQFGGPGKFGFREEMHITEHSPLLTPGNKERIFREWSRYWDMGKPLLMEKSPPNILKTRFLQALFPNSYFIVITRHPIATSYATQKWSNTGINSLLEHWITCHRIFEQDKRHLRNLFVLKYEDFVKEPDIFLKQIYNFLGIPDHTRTIEIQAQVNKKYFEQWQREIGQKNRIKEKWFHFKYRKIEKEINKFEYCLYDISLSYPGGIVYGGKK